VIEVAFGATLAVEGYERLQIRLVHWPAESASDQGRENRVRARLFVLGRCRAAHKDAGAAGSVTAAGCVVGTEHAHARNFGWAETLRDLETFEFRAIQPEVQFGRWRRAARIHGQKTPAAGRCGQFRLRGLSQESRSDGAQTSLDRQPKLMACTILTATHADTQDVLGIERE